MIKIESKESKNNADSCVSSEIWEVEWLLYYYSEHYVGFDLVDTYVSKEIIERLK